MEKADTLVGPHRRARAWLRPDMARHGLVALLLSALAVWALSWPIDHRLSAFREASAQALFSRLIEHESQQLDQLTSLLGSDYALREAVATHDTRTIVSALRNHQRRVGADFSVMVSPEGVVLGDSSGVRTAGEPLRRTDPLAGAGNKDAPRLTLVSGRLYRISSAQVMAPVAYGTLLVGYRIEKRLAHATRTMLYLNTSFACVGASGIPQLTERPDVPGADGLLTREFERLSTGAGRGMALPGGEQVVATHSLDGGEGSQCVAALSGDGSVAHQPVLVTQTLALVLAALAAAGLLVLRQGRRRPTATRP